VCRLLSSSRSSVASRTRRRGKCCLNGHVHRLVTATCQRMCCLAHDIVHTFRLHCVLPSPLLRVSATWRASVRLLLKCVILTFIRIVRPPSTRHTAPAPGRHIRRQRGPGRRWQRGRGAGRRPQRHYHRARFQHAGDARRCTSAIHLNRTDMSNLGVMCIDPCAR
jgi:hypothetical protein